MGPSAIRDVLVIGGGPAGAATAIFLKQRGHDVLLIDTAHFPRDKICGEGVSPEAWRSLRALGAEPAVTALRPWPLRGMTLFSPDGTSFSGEYRGSRRAGFAVRRRELDHALLACASAAGVEVHEGTRASGLVRSNGRVDGVTADEQGRTTILRARVLIAADGRRSLLARRLGLLREHRRLRKFAVRGHWEGMEGLRERGEMHVGGGGYCGIAPLSASRANVTFVLDRRALAPARAGLAAFYRSALRERWPRVAERLEKAALLEPPRAIGPLAVQARRLSFPGGLLVGDAAGFYDPFTGEGVTLALRGAELAAEVADRALRRGATSTRLVEYDRLRDEATRDKFRLNRLLQRVVGWPALSNAVAHRLAERNDLADRLVGIAGDFVPARTAFDLAFLRDLLLG